MNQKQITNYVLIMILAAAVLRLFPYLVTMEENFVQPIFAMGIFGISVFRKRWYAALIPLAAMLLSDVLIELVRPGAGFYTGMAENYACIIVSVSFAYFIKPASSRQVTLAALVVPTVFFLISNYFMWQNSGMYAKNAAGLLTCYEMALPFYMKDLVSTALFSGLLFGIYNFVLQRNAVKQRA
jgi:hypothetical protein